jgi:hypothetical protein
MSTKATTCTRRANRTAVHRAIKAAGEGVSTTIEASPWMSLENALAVAIGILDEDTDAGRATAYVTGNVLYIGPRKKVGLPLDPD